MKLHSTRLALLVLAALAVALGGFVAPDVAQAGMAPPPVCGNDVEERGEDCDGTDDAACPGQCQVDCTCPAPLSLEERVAALETSVAALETLSGQVASLETQHQTITEQVASLENEQQGLSQQVEALET